MNLIKLDWRELAYVNADISERVLDTIFEIIVATDVCIFVSPENLNWCIYLEKYKYSYYLKYGMTLTKNISVRVFPDSKLKGDTWVVRSKYFEIHGEGA